ncbi:aromatic ring-hydroxylating dioxygenase subunit alpha [Nostocaceae cyanobacterium CENA357]|uniref:Aromatic ring-hydroxylating dioxygenase subunit alpha n=1 Tax=Atlanticothrix silvestris CENA357 TaxID=1725252 RepID=A0A8J7HJD4_9CYAN|nr:aromatic ring-hydroxylating dioxygenase subunit alpha [Atlanticothrix silvestris]MBH8553671.1 aromatic ring-hydroxylating dioxygenase subunit alpha [Atlanticothrix silvestris CENA357]
MFKMFPNFWTPVLPVAEIGSDPIAVKLAGESLVLFRSSFGQFAAFIDRCPHRGAPLSHGQVIENGCLECPYHGWQFASNGACTHVPFNSLKAAQLSKLSVVSFPVRVIAGMVWIFTGTENVPEPQLPSSLLESNDRYVIHHEIWNAHWTRAIDISLDYLHIPFVHRDSFGHEFHDPTHRNATAQINVTATADGMAIMNRLDTLPYGVEIDWHQPNQVVLKLDLGGMPLRPHLFAIPINPQQLRFVQVVLPSPGIDRSNFDFDDFFAASQDDRTMTESQVGEIPNMNEGCNVPTDEPSLRFCRWYYSVMKNKEAEGIQDTSVI